MIVKYPTGLYYTVVPNKPSDNGNVTWNMSMPPPKITQAFTKLPDGITHQQRTPSTLTMDQRRRVLGALVYSTTSTSRTELGTSTKQYTTGQLLNFTDDTSEDTISILPLANTSSDIQHGLNQLNYTNLGLSNTDQAVIAAASNVTYAQLQSDVAKARAAYMSLQTLMSEDQKVVNETNTAITALQVLANGNPAIITMVATLQTTKTNALTRITDNSNAANAEIIIVNSLIDQLNNLAQLME